MGRFLRFVRFVRFVRKKERRKGKKEVVATVPPDELDMYLCTCAWYMRKCRDLLLLPWHAYLVVSEG